MSTQPARATTPVSAPEAVASPGPDPVRYAERRAVPWWWWAVAVVLIVPSVEAVAVFGPDMQTEAGWPVAVGALVGSLALISALLVSISRSPVVVDANGLRAGRRRLPATAVGRARVLDAATARQVLGPNARADAELSLRPWIRTAVQVEVRHDDSGAYDSTAPYWVVASRRPAELVAALRMLDDRRMLDGGRPAQPS